MDENYAKTTIKASDYSRGRHKIRSNRNGVCSVCS